MHLTLRAATCALLMPLAFTAQQTSQAQLNEALGVAASVPAHVLFEGTPGGAAQATVLYGDTLLDLQLEPHSVRSPKFQLLVQGDDGDLTPQAAAASRAYRGRVEAFGGAQFAASWLTDGLHARIRTDAGEDFWIQPIPAEFQTPGGAAHAFYAGIDVLDPEKNCGTDLLPLVAGSRPGLSNGGGSAPKAQVISVAELGCDADFQYFQRYGTVQATVDRVESVINAMNLQYESEVELTHQITTTVVRTSSGANPYTTSNSSTLLSQFRNEWNNNQGAIQRDVAQLFTGRNLSGSVIGIAYIGAICGSFGYGVVEADFISNFACTTDLSAHELGHNWNAPHCNCPQNTMNSGITCRNTFRSSTQNVIRNFAATRNCLSTATCAAASVANRNGGTNPQAYTATPAVIGQPSTFTVDTQGFQFATIFGVANPANRPLDGGLALIQIDSQLLLMLGPLPGPTAQTTAIVTSDPAMCGITIYTQAKLDNGPGSFIVTNAQDLTVGT